jgi:DNA polymerase III sliding clamp (beta) subunit (PCNA family)
MNTFNIRPSVMRDILAGALVAACKDSGLWILNSVHVSFSDGIVETASTDRYRLSTGRTTVDTMTGEASFILTSKDAAILVKSLPKMPKRMGESEYLVVTVDEGTVTFAEPGWSQTFQTLEGSFPDWRGLLANQDKNQGRVERWTCNASYLADMDKIPHDPKLPVTMMFTESCNPMIATYREWNHATYRYMLMPVRLV